jgi:hypothetical protein
MLLAGILASSQFFLDLLLSRREKERIDPVILDLIMPGMEVWNV